MDAEDRLGVFIVPGEHFAYEERSVDSPSRGEAQDYPGVRASRCNTQIRSIFSSA